ncbi:MAG TPA: PaaI family thioesterase [Saprospiraceae bacterium]|nr:PaaI family thioesterase [Saprospiraceae bacterium]
MNYEATDPDFILRVQESFSKQKFMEYIDAKLVIVKPGFCEIHLPYNINLTQQNGFFHAGIIGSIADNAAGYAAYSLMHRDASVLAVEFKLNLLSPADGELIIGRSTVLKYGKTLSICRSDVFVVKNGMEKLCAASQSTMMELSNYKKPD